MCQLFTIKSCFSFPLLINCVGALLLSRHLANVKFQQCMSLSTAKWEIKLRSIHVFEFETFHYTLTYFCYWCIIFFLYLFKLFWNSWTTGSFGNDKVFDIFFKTFFVYQIYWNIYIKKVPWWMDFSEINLYSFRCFCSHCPLHAVSNIHC